MARILPQMQHFAFPDVCVACGTPIWAIPEQVWAIEFYIPITDFSYNQTNFERWFKYEAYVCNHCYRMYWRQSHGGA